MQLDGDPRHQFYVGREDGSLVLARRLLWEEQARYALNVSVSDGLNLVYTTVSGEWNSELTREEIASCGGK